MYVPVHALQTEQRRRAEAARKAAEAAAEAKQDADIAAYHGRLRDKEAERQHHQASIGRDDQPAGNTASVHCCCLHIFATPLIICCSLTTVPRCASWSILHKQTFLHRVKVVHVTSPSDAC